MLIYGADQGALSAKKSGRNRVHGNLCNLSLVRPSWFRPNPCGRDGCNFVKLCPGTA